MVFDEDNEGRKKKKKKKEKKEEKEGEKKEKEKCIDSIIYVHFLTDIKAIQGKPDSLAASLSKHRAKFNKLYDELCGKDAYFSRNSG